MQSYKVLPLNSLVYCFFALPLFLLNTSESLSRGAPTTACRSLMPAHGFPAKTTIPPYRIIARPATIYPNESVKVRIRVKSKRFRFKGFILQAKAAEYWQRIYQPAIGVFQPTEGTKRLSCFRNDHNTLTHNHAQHNEEITAIWLPPKDFRGAVTFAGTIVATFKKYWTKVSSNTIVILDYSDTKES